MFVKPKANRAVFNPEMRRNLPESGEATSQAFDSYWIRRDQDGDVEISAAPPASANKKGSE